MSFWSGLLSAIPVVGPIVGGIVEGVEQSHAAHKAADQQTAAANQSLDVYKQALADQEAAQKPYTTAGAAAASALPAFLGLGALGAGSPSSGVASSPMAAGTAGPGLTRGSSANYPLPMGAISDPAANGGNAAQAPGTTTLSGSSYTPNAQAPGYGPQSSPIPNIRVRKPDGSEVAIPANLVSQAVANGGTVLGEAA